MATSLCKESFAEKRRRVTAPADRRTSATSRIRECLERVSNALPSQNVAMTVELEVKNAGATLTYVD